MNGLRRKLEERFNHIDRHVVKGIGLGLAVVKRVAELHGGALRLPDGTGEGNDYVLELPAGRPA